MTPPLTTCILNLLVFIMLWTRLVGQEPAYHDIVYGGAWKHVTINPSKKYTDVGQVEEKLLPYIHNLELFLESSVDALECYTMINLLYSFTDREPLLYTKELFSSDGSVYSVSIPMSTGSTYYCELKTTQKEISHLHYITVTNMIGEDPIFIHSHIFFSLEYKHFAFSSSYSLVGECERSNYNQMNSSGLYILTSLSRKKDLYSPICLVKSELSKMMANRKSSCHNDICKDENDSQSNVTSQLKIMTYNVWNFNPYFKDVLYHQRISRLIKTIAKASPDIIGLQEARLEALQGGSLGPNQMDHIIPHLKHYQYVFQPAQLFDVSLKNGRTEEGVAILSKFPIVHHDYLLLFRNRSNSADGHQRVCLHVVISVPKVGLVHVFNTHYSLSHEAREEASRQVLEFMGMHEGPAVLLGDLNATPEEKAIRMLLNSTDLIDAWPYLHHEDPGYTFNTLENKLSKRIDYILMRKLPDVELKSVRVLDDRTRSNICSDHRAVQAIMAFKTCH